MTNPSTFAERHLRSIARVYDADIRLVPIDGRPGAFLSTSTDGRRRYHTTDRTCSCQAGLMGAPICRHRTAVQLRLGLIDEPAFPFIESPAYRLWAGQEASA